MSIEQAQRSAPPVRMQLGTAPGQPSLRSPSLSAPADAPPRKRELMSGAAVLPELAEAPVAERKWWKHPAFIVSIITTFLALVAAIVLLIVGIVTDDTARVSGLGLDLGTGNAQLSWDGPDVPYSLYAVAGSGDVTDLSQPFVKGREAWLPVGLGQFDEETCFVVRPASITDDVSLSADTLASQGAQSACVASARE